MSRLLLVIGPNCAVNHSEQNNGRAWGEKNGGLCKYLSGMDVDYPSALFCSRRFPSLTDQIAAGNINIDIISALEMDAART